MTHDVAGVDRPMCIIARDLRCPATMTCFDALQDTLAALWADAPEVGDVDRMLFETALVEIVGNLVEHARTTADEPVTIDVHVAVHADRVEALLVDDGMQPYGLDLTAVVEPVDELAEGGRGLALAQAVAEVAHARGGGGNRWTVTRRRTGV